MSVRNVCLAASTTGVNLRPSRLSEHSMSKLIGPPVYRPTTSDALQRLVDPRRSSPLQATPPVYRPFSSFAAQRAIQPAPPIYKPIASTPVQRSGNAAALVRSPLPCKPATAPVTQQKPFVPGWAGRASMPLQGIAGLPGAGPFRPTMETPPKAPMSSPSVRADVLQCVRGPLTMNQANPAREDQTTNLKAAIDGVSRQIFKNGGALGHADMLALQTIGWTAPRHPPHAEEKFAAWLLRTEDEVSYISLSMDRSPCSRCAELLSLLKQHYDADVRIKVAQSHSKDQRLGMILLATEGFDYQIMTRQRLKTKYPGLRGIWKNHKRGLNSKGQRVASGDRYRARYAAYKNKIIEDHNLAKSFFGDEVTLQWNQRGLSWKDI